MCHVGLLTSERVGNQVQFQANQGHPVFAELQAVICKTTGYEWNASPLYDGVTM